MTNPIIFIPSIVSYDSHSIIGVYRKRDDAVTANKFRFRHKSGIIFNGSVLELSREFDIPHTCIYDIINHQDRNIQTHGWYIW